VGGVVRWFDPSYGVEYVGNTDLARINSFEDQSLYGLIQPDVADLEIKLNVDLDSDGNITPDSGMTNNVKQIAVKRQQPGVKDTDYSFKNY
jgi:hypothetical protein